MELSQPGVDLLGRVQALTLLALARQTGGTSGRELARLIGEPSHSSVRRALQRLVLTGLVTAEESANALLYTLNRGHVYWDAVFELLASPAKVEKRIADIVSGISDAELTVSLFGSVARGEAAAHSDIDIFIVVPNETFSTTTERLVDELTDGLVMYTGNNVQVVVVNETQLQRMVATQDPLVQELQKDTKTLLGPDLRSRLLTGGRQ